jgi:hypothetical protein
MLAGTTLQHVDSLNVSQQADQFPSTNGISQEKTVLSVSLEPMALDTPTRADRMTNNSLQSGGDDTSDLMKNTENVSPSDPDKVGSLASNTMSPRRQIGRSTDEQVTRTKRTPSKKRPGSQETQNLPRGTITDRSGAKVVTAPNNKRTWNNVNDDVAVVDLTSSPKKRTKSDEDDKSDESAACSPKPSTGAQTDNTSQGVSMLPVTSLLEKALEGRCELEQMNVRYVFTQVPYFSVYNLC